MYWTGTEENIYSTLDIFSELEVKKITSPGGLTAELEIAKGWDQRLGSSLILR